MLFQQWRLIPFLAAAYALEHFTRSIFMDFVEFRIGQAMRLKDDRQVSSDGCMGVYPNLESLKIQRLYWNIHNISSVWEIEILRTNNAIQYCRVSF